MSSLDEERSSLGEEISREMARVRDVVMPRYLAAAIMMRVALDGAAKAMVKGDVDAMIYWHQELKGFEL